VLEGFKSMARRPAAAAYRRMLDWFGTYVASTR